MWMGRPERIEDDIALVMMRIEFDDVQLLIAFCLGCCVRVDRSIVMA